MNIIILSENPPVLKLEFDPVEVSHELFTTAKEEVGKAERIEITSEKIEETKYMSTVEEVGFIEPKKPIKGEIIEPLPIKPIIIDPKPSTIEINGEPVEGEHPTITIGKMIDSLREQYTGTVVPAEIDYVDEKTGETVYKEKDLSKCPQFKIGVLETVDNYVEIMDDVNQVEEEIKEDIL